MASENARQIYGTSDKTNQSGRITSDVEIFPQRKTIRLLDSHMVFR